MPFLNLFAYILIIITNLKSDNYSPFTLLLKVTKTGHIQL